MSVRHDDRRLLLSLLVLWLSGCGGSTPPAGSPPPPAVLAPPPNQPAAATAALPRKAATAKPAGSQTPASSTLPEGVDPQDVAEIGAVDPTFEVLAPDSVRPDDLFTVIATSSAESSNVFQIAASPGPAAAQAPPATAFKLPAGFQAVRKAGYSAEGMPERIVDDKTGAEMALIPAGVSYLGASLGPDNAKPQVPVLLEPFYIDVTEVTLADFERYRSELKELKRPRPQDPANLHAPPTQPVVGVSWITANGFAKWAGKDLPTEAEFEKAARGPDGFRAPWGNGRAIWPDGRTPTTISPVASYRSDLSPYGVFDLAGNAREWCSDWYSEDGHREARASGAGTIKNWTGPRKASVANQRVVKGGADDWSAWSRAGCGMSDHPDDVGFRCVLRVAQPGESSPRTTGFRQPAASN